MSGSRLPTTLVARKRGGGFTLVELLVVIGIIGLLVGILVPVLGRARESANTVACISNLRQMAQAALVYTEANGGQFPSAYYSVSAPPLAISYNWDFTTTLDSSTGTRTVAGGLLWPGDRAAVQQCPSFTGKSNTVADPFTGYNYNTSYIGRGQSEGTKRPAFLREIKDPTKTVIFGDGQYANGANKFMRSPLASPFEVGMVGRVAGTQGFRHRGKTNVAFVDGHVESMEKPFAAEQLVAPGTGFLADTNELYDLQ